LKDVPENTIIFTRLVLINSLIETISYPIMTAVSAKGKIKLYQSITGGLIILNLPLSYLFLKKGFRPETTMYIAIIISLISQISRIIFIKILHNISISEYFYEVIVRIMSVSILSFIFPCIVWYIMPESWVRLLIIIIISTIAILLTSISIGINSEDRKLIIKETKDKIYNMYIKYEIFRSN
jgi:hypothetical protein